jgi:non-ribosomal peptide synthetase component F
VGLLINTVPVRANITSTTTASALLERLQRDHAQTLDHQHIALNDIHRITGQERLFDTVFVFENYPTGTAGGGGEAELVVTDVAARDFYHYPLTIQAVPGRELELRIQYRTDVFDDAAVEAMAATFGRLLDDMVADPGAPLSVTDQVDDVVRSTTAASAAEWAPHRHETGRGPVSLVEQTLAGIYAQVLDIDGIGVDQSFFDLGGDSLSAMRAIAAVNSAFDTDLAVNALFDAPSVSSLSKQLAETATNWKQFPT